MKQGEAATHQLQEHEGTIYDSVAFNAAASLLNSLNKNNGAAANNVKRPTRTSCFTCIVTSTKQKMSLSKQSNSPVNNPVSKTAAADAAAACLLESHSMYTVAAAGVTSKASPSPQGLAFFIRKRTNHKHMAENNKRNIQGDATTREKGQDHKDETRQQQTQARQRETGTQQTSEQPARRDPNQR